MSSDAPLLEHKPECGAHGTLEGQAQPRANTTAHMCWYRSTSVSRADRSAAVEVGVHRGPSSSICPADSPVPEALLASPQLGRESLSCGLGARPTVTGLPTPPAPFRLAPRAEGSGGAKQTQSSCRSPAGRGPGEGAPARPVVPGANPGEREAAAAGAGTQARASLRTSCQATC